MPENETVESRAAVRIFTGTRADGDGTNLQPLVDADGHFQIDVVSSLLPTGGATEATLAALSAKVTACNTGAVVIASGSCAVTAASLPLPSGAATSVLQGGGMPAALGAGGGLKVDGSGTALPVSGTVTANIGTVGTLAVESGGNLAAILTALQAGNGNGLTFSRVKIDNNARMTLLAGTAGKIKRLHALVLVATAAATVKVSYDDDGAATSEVDLTGAMAVAANGGLVIPFNADPRACLATAASKYLTLTPSAAVDGYAVVSTD